jgi:hypothetical protein
MLPMISSSFLLVSDGGQALDSPYSPSKVRLVRRWAPWACHMAMMPINTMIAEKMTLLMVTGSHVSDEPLA